MENKIVTDGRRQRSIKTKQAIIEATKTIFLEKGYRKTTFKDISLRAGVGYGTIYWYFKNKEEILKTIVDDIMSIIKELVYIEYNPSKFTDIKEIVYQQIYNVLILGESHRTELKIIWDALAHSEAIRKHWNSVINMFVERIVEDLNYSQEHRLAKSLNPNIIAKAIVFLTQDFLWEIVWSTEVDIDELSNNLTALYTQGAYINTQLK